MKPITFGKPLEQILEENFKGLHSGGARSSILGGQTAADAALARVDLKGYAKNRSQVLPTNHRGASVLSPYIRHNILPLREVWDRAGEFPFDDREKFRDELMWQEYARHLYARIGTRLFRDLRFSQNAKNQGHGWNTDLNCVDFVVDELRRDGWLVNQTRMWLASQWAVRNSHDWLSGQELMFQELLDGSRAANLLGWQWTVGSGTGKAYGFARWQVEKRAPELCGKCVLQNACPIQQFPDERELTPVDDYPLLARDPDPLQTSGPDRPLSNRPPKKVLLTIESLGDQDPALEANPSLPAVFIFNEVALGKLQLAAKRIYFYLETLEDLATRRDLEVFVGDPVAYAQGHEVAVTYAPVPSFSKFSNLAEIHPYPWLRLPHGKSVKSFSAWRNGFAR